MPPARLTCSKCGHDAAPANGDAATCPACGHVESARASARRALVGLQLELEACEDRWAKQRVRLSTIRSDGTLVRPNGLLIVPAAVASTTACVWLVNQTLQAHEADGLPFLLSLAATAVAALSLVQLRRWLEYELGKRVFLSGRRRLGAAIASAQSSAGEGERASRPSGVGEVRGARHASDERAAE